MQVVSEITRSLLFRPPNFSKIQSSPGRSTAALELPMDCACHAMAAVGSELLLAGSGCRPWQRLDWRLGQFRPSLVTGIMA